MTELQSTIELPVDRTGEAGDVGLPTLGGGAEPVAPIVEELMQRLKLARSVRDIIDNEGDLSRDFSFYSGYKDPTSGFGYSFNVPGVQISSEGVAVQINFGGGGFIVVNDPKLPEYLINPEGSIQIRYPHNHTDSEFRELSSHELHEDDIEVLKAIMDVLLEEMSN